MPYTVVRNHPGCNGYAVVKTNDKAGHVFGCHATAKEAGAQIGAITKSEQSVEDETLEVTETLADVPVEVVMPNGWSGAIAGLDILTGDERYLATPKGGVRTREYPLSLTLGHVGDGEAPVIGSVDRVWVQDGLLYGEGKIDLGGDAGAEFARQLTEGYINTVSIHPDQVTAEYQLVDPTGKVMSGEEADKLIIENDYSIPEGYTTRTAFTDWRLAGLAVVPIPAYTEARIEGNYDYMGPADHATDALVAAVGGQIFTREFFGDPKLKNVTQLTVTDDGKVYGHIALWNSCYQLGGGANAYASCTKPPHSATGYSRFHTHKAFLGGNDFIPCGTLTAGDGHVTRGGLKASQENYANVATQVAKVVAGEDRFGIWVSGEILDAARDHAHDLLDSPLSAHWEPDADAAHNLEMIAAHVVNVPGFAVRPIIASFSDGETLDGLSLLSKIVTDFDTVNTDAIIELAIAVADEIEKRGVAKEKSAAEAMRQIHMASVVERIREDQRTQRLAAVQSRLGI